MLAAVGSRSGPVVMIPMMIVPLAFKMLLFHKKFCISRPSLAFVICPLDYCAMPENVIF